MNEYKIVIDGVVGDDWRITTKRFHGPPASHVLPIKREKKK